jgi:hypothetical protein
MGRKPTGNPTGRPSTYDPAYCDRVVELGRLGYSKSRICADLDISRPTLDKWAKNQSEFGNALARALEASHAFWDERLAKGMNEGKAFNAQAAKLLLSSMFEDYQENRNLKVSGALAHFDLGKLLPGLPAEIVQRIAAGEDAAVILAGLAAENFRRIEAATSEKSEARETSYELIGAGPEPE